MQKRKCFFKSIGNINHKCESLKRRSGNSSEITLFALCFPHNISNKRAWDDLHLAAGDLKRSFPLLKVSVRVVDHLMSD